MRANHVESCRRPRTLLHGTSPVVILRRDRDDAVVGRSAKLNSIAAPMCHSPTYDQGKEMTRHAELAARTGENNDGLLRQYLPKGTDLSAHTQDGLDAVSDGLNGRLRATHAFRTPLEVFT